MELKWTTDISSNVYRECLKIRQEVFMKEQKVPLELEIEGEEADCIYLVLYEDNKPVGTGRLYPIDDDLAIIQRVAVLKEHRKQGFGKFMVQALIDKAREMNFTHLHLHAQVSAQNLYARLGFKSYGNTFMEAGIKHQEMRLDL